ncbi:MAG TPA: toluene-4-monooxygenase system B family protein [Polyangia bacterium]|nr:toluene-4-monooxygenase system B family protein [Polyangia bacterium]
MSVLPLYAFVEGDTMGVVVLGRLEGTVADLGENLLRAVGVRVARRGPYQLLAGARRLDPEATLAAQALAPLERVDLVWTEAARR